MSNSTSNKLEIRPTEGGLYEVYWSGGGELPDALKGRYTFVDWAEKAIEMYQLKLHDKLSKTRARATKQQATVNAS